MGEPEPAAGGLSGLPREQPANATQPKITAAAILAENLCLRAIVSITDHTPAADQRFRRDLRRGQIRSKHGVPAIDAPPGEHAWPGAARTARRVDVFPAENDAAGTIKQAMLVGS